MMKDVDLSEIIVKNETRNPMTSMIPKMMKWSEWRSKDLDLTLTECHTVYESLKNGNRFILSRSPPHNAVMSIVFMGKNMYLQNNSLLYYVDNDVRRRLLKEIKAKLGP
jgi:hypothetical protein